jgi:hypothetical protein
VGRGPPKAHPEPPPNPPEAPLWAPLRGPPFGGAAQRAGCLGGAKLPHQAKLSGFWGEAPTGFAQGLGELCSPQAQRAGCLGGLWPPRAGQSPGGLGARGPTRRGLGSFAPHRQRSWGLGQQGCQGLLYFFFYFFLFFF